MALIKEDIARQMRDAGMDVSGLKITIRSPKEMEKFTKAPEPSKPSPADIGAQMHEQICSQVESSLGDQPLDKIGSFDIDVQDPTSGKTFKFTISPSKFKGMFCFFSRFKERCILLLNYHVK